MQAQNPRKARVGSREDNVGLAAEFAVASCLTNAGWFATVMPSTTFPGIDIMARRHGFEPISVQVKATRARRSFFVIDKGATQASSRLPETPARIYVFASNPEPGFGTAWTFWVMTRDEVRQSTSRPGRTGTNITARQACTEAHRNAWWKIESVAQQL